ncbi:ankyrin repeat and SOCS box protein 10 isoform X5 [Spea bombifrons]|uniref:ankyrin repeat and SOCS box protein 10 isoform X5 n=1 Tax=Spea bombifrons TaxID=233779 RepID=UPI00234BFA84|nr:ankyrin repeat and SOCS box protein 10 isoform X5 [Spea bombifrons]
MYRGIIVTHKAEGAPLKYWMSLLSGDTESVRALLRDAEDQIHPNSVFDTSDLEEWKEYRYNTTALRIWSLTYEEEFTCPLYVTATRGYAECLQLLLREGADVEFAPGGESALHGACENAQPKCAEILLRYGANPNSRSEEGTFPLHRCTTHQSYPCSKLLLQYGAHVNSQSEDEEETPLHVASRHGMWEHVDLYLRYGAAVNKKNVNGETPLCAACGQPQSPQELEQYFQVCRRLIESGADIHAGDRDQQTPLHVACKSANPQVVELLLEHGAEVNIMSYSGNTAMHNILQTIAYKLQHQPEIIVRALLNHGAIRVWPGALIKKHLRFFESVFSLSERPRSLQHLCRCALRSYLEGRLPQTLPNLPLPPPLRQFLQLRFEDVLY